MFTSCFKNVKRIPPELRPVAISIGVPSWWKGPRELRLAPERGWLKLPAPEFDRLYAALLARLDAAELYAALGENAVLLCWEAPGVPCHRRTVAAWFHQHLGVTVPEWNGQGVLPPQRSLFPDMQLPAGRRR